MATEGMDSKDRFDASDWLQPTASAQSLFWQPNFVANSELLQHLPFLFWAIETIRPQDAAVIGVGEGVGHFGICQAFDELTLPGCCRGFGFWGLGQALADGLKFMLKEGNIFETIGEAWAVVGLV